MLSSKSLHLLKTPLKLGFRALFVFLGYSSATWLSVFLVLAIQLCVLGWLTNAPTQLVETKITNIDEFGMSGSTRGQQAKKSLNWPRIKITSLVVFLGIFNAMIFYLVGWLFSPK